MQRPNGFCSDRMLFRVVVKLLASKKLMIVSGAVMIAEAKITGMTLAELIFNGKYVISLRPLVMELDVYCTGIFRVASCMKTTSTMIKRYINTYSMNVRMPLNIAVLFVVSTRVLKTWMNWNGMFATIPAKMMMETPFPIPFTEI